MSQESLLHPSEGLAMNWVLDHVLTHPAPYETRLPLRTIYTLNAQTTCTSTADFKMMLMEHVQHSPVQPCTLPPVFLTTFIRKCFPQESSNVDFDQALTALDYLSDLEIRRKKELEKAIHARGPHDSKVIALRNKSAKLDLVYAKSLVGLRRHTLINELSLPRFNKCNCIALLNTLYPIQEADINSHLTAGILAQQRVALWQYITRVERKGPRVLDSVRDANNGWQAVSENVSQYCSISLDIIQKAEDLGRPTSYGSFSSEASSSQPSSPQLASPLRRDSTNESIEGESEHHKKSTLEKIVRGLAKLGHHSSSKKSFSHSLDWNRSQESV